MGSWGWGAAIGWLGLSTAGKLFQEMNPAGTERSHVFPGDSLRVSSVARDTQATQATAWAEG